MTTKQLTIKTEKFTAIVTGAGAKGFSFKVTKGNATRRDVRRTMKRTMKVKVLK